jgi:predicted TIM-barrel fold metal-dependent hydrolase
MLEEHAGDLTDEQRRAILSENAASLYGIETAELATAS